MARIINTRGGTSRKDARSTQVKNSMKRSLKWVLFFNIVNFLLIGSLVVDKFDLLPKIMTWLRSMGVL